MKEALRTVHVFEDAWWVLWRLHWYYLQLLYFYLTQAYAGLVGMLWTSQHHTSKYDGKA